ncbi:protein kinase family protein [Nonomuraea roseoviolacea]|uniref:Protein kinase family protein n=1 Tax=Nonomuraea roseoviolacea subsp. carminata TaxID=160689 RepID=A0ABT1KAR9_9ACTN|nr:protein kinase family protein [Nonomuraea roseoviolacea]MCP2351119.1 hypothetical protein [Nonomuraea roseoviolacea subsp. carminata]
MNATERTGTGTRRERLRAYDAVSTSLALLGDRRLGELLDGAVPAGAGIGGTSARLEVEGVPVFVKRVPLTDVELLPANRGSTADLFGLPPFFQYGIGSPGFGAWRELATHVMTTNWVLSGAFGGFPLTYHWRVLPDGAPAPHELLADVDRAVGFWGGSAGVRRRLEALRDASASLVLFLEHVPYNLHQWMSGRMRAGGRAADRACALVERELAAGVAFMNARGLLHFDAHFLNVLTDGRRLYFADFGLAVSSRFELSPAEAAFHDRHRAYDRCYTLTQLVRWLAAELHGFDGREERIAAWAGGEPPEGAPEKAAALLSRYSPLARVMSAFFHALQRESRTTPYPLEELRGAWARCGLG